MKEVLSFHQEQKIILTKVFHIVKKKKKISPFKTFKMERSNSTSKALCNLYLNNVLHFDFRFTFSSFIFRSI